MPSLRNILIQGSVVGGIALTGYATWFIRERLKAAREKRLARQNYWSGILSGIKITLSAAALGAVYLSYRSTVARLTDGR